MIDPCFLFQQFSSSNAVLELCGGHMSEVSALEMLKRDDIFFQVIDEDDILDELDELALDDDDDDDYYED
jgi:hypothetical protein